MENRAAGGIAEGVERGIAFHIGKFILTDGDVNGDRGACARSSGSSLVTVVIRLQTAGFIT
jgi:hypothetical protein